MGPSQVTQMFEEQDNELIAFEKEELRTLEMEMKLCELSNHALAIKTLKRLAYLQAKYNE